VSIESAANFPDISFVIVTRDRAEFLDRQFAYLQSFGFRGEIFLGDASSTNQVANVLNVVEKHKETLKLNATFYPPETPIFDRLRGELNKVSSSLVMWVGDDDFVVVEGLQAAETKLKSAMTASAIVGRALLFETEKSRPWGRLTGFCGYPQHPYAGQAAANRLEAFHAKPCALTYSLRRTKLAKRILDSVARCGIPDNVIGYFLFETLDALITVASGNVLLVDELLLVRQSHAGSSSSRGKLLSLWFDFMDSQDWPLIKSKVSQELNTVMAEEHLAGDNSESLRYARLAIWQSIYRLLKRIPEFQPPCPFSPSIGTRTLVNLKRLAPLLAHNAARQRSLYKLREPDRTRMRRLIRFIEGGPRQYSGGL
jgi:glycosyltransferase domain-containing protein